ncbi:MAG: enoyl-CoA hydratase/isomerase family protein [Bacteroidetes bacterium]|nr:enoyl-CoA hydratase/isomerase family protein [Bacteroidota bacterium]
MYNSLLYTIADGVCTITLNRPDVYNAFNEELSVEFIDALKKSAKDDAVRVVVITGAGKAFCSGQDLQDVKKSDGKRSLGDSVLRRYNPMILGVRESPKPVVCRLNGVAAGAGASLAMACDIIVASEAASLVQAFANIGLVLDSGSSFFLPGLIGYNKAFELCTLGSKVTAKEAFDLGIINKLVAPEELDAAVKAYTDRYATAAPKSMAIIKKMLNKGLTANLREMLQYEAYSQEIAGSTEDYKEGVTAFVEKRKAVFRGK